MLHLDAALQRLEGQIRPPTPGGTDTPAAPQTYWPTGTDARCPGCGRPTEQPGQPCNECRMAEGSSQDSPPN